MSNGQVEQKRSEVSNLIRSMYHQYEDIEDDSLLLTEYIYKNPDQFDNFKHLLPDVTQQELEQKKQEAIDIQGIPAEKAEPAEVFGWTSRRALQPIPRHIVTGLDAQLATLAPDPERYEEQLGHEAATGLNILAQQAGETTPEFIRDFEESISNRISERETRAKEYWKDWENNNEAYVAHQKYKLDNPTNMWAPWSWDWTDKAEIAATVLTELGTQLPIGFFGGPSASFMYNYTRILGGGIGRRIEELEKKGLTPQEAFRTANALSQASALGQGVAESFLPIMFRNQVKGFGSIFKNNIAKRLTPDKIRLGTKSGLLGDFSKVTGKDILKDAFVEAGTEWGQHIYDKSVDKYGIDETINIWKQAWNQEAAQNFWAGFLGGSITGSAAMAFNKRNALNFKMPNINTEGGASDQEALIDKHLAEYTAPDTETAEQAKAFVDGHNEARKITSLGGRQLAVNLADKMREEAKVRSDEAIIIDRVLSDSKENLTPAEIAKLEQIEIDTGLSQEELLQAAVQDPNAIIEAGYSPEVVAEYIVDNEMGMPEQLAPYAPLPEMPEAPEGIVPIAPELPFMPEPPFVPEAPFIPKTPEQLREEEIESLIAQGAPRIPVKPKVVEELPSLTKENLMLKKVPELQKMLKSAKLLISGNKPALVARIINAPKEAQLLWEEVKKAPEKLVSKEEVKDLLKAQEKIELFDIDKKESRLVPLTDPTAGDKASEAIGRYMGAVYKKMGKSADYHIEKGTVKLPKKINFKHFNKKYTIEKLDDVPLRDANRRKIDPDKGFYKLVDDKGSVVQDVFPVTKEAQRILEDSEKRKIARKAKNTEFIEFMFGKRPAAGDDLQIVGKQFYPNKTAHLAIMKSFSETGIPHMPTEMKYILDQVELEELLGMPLDWRQMRNRDVFLSNLKKSLSSAKDVYIGKGFDKKFKAIMSFFEYLPKHVFNNVITLLEEFNGTTYAYTLSGTHFPVGYVAPWRGVLEKVYEIHKLDISKIDLINTDQAAREGWFSSIIATGEQQGQTYIKRRDAIVNHLAHYHGDKFGKDKTAVFNEVEFAIDKATIEVRKDIEKALTKRLKDKYGINNGLKLLPMVLMTFGKSKVNIADQIFEAPIHELTHHIEFLAKGTPEWKKVQVILDKIAKNEEMAPFLQAMLPNYMDKIFKSFVKGEDPNKIIKTELLAHIMQRVVYDELGLGDKYTYAKTDLILDKILEEGKRGENLYDKLKALILRMVNWISNKFRGKAFEETDKVYDHIIDLRKAFYEVVHKKDIFEEPFKNKTAYFDKPYYNRIVKSKQDIFRIFDFMWEQAKERTKGVIIDADVFLNDVSNMLDEHNLGEFKAIFNEWIDDRSKAKKINWNRHLRDKNPAVEEFSWLSGYQSDATAEQMFYDSVYLLKPVDMKAVHVRKSGNLLDFIPLYSLGITLTRKEAGLLAESTKNDIEFKDWLSGPQENITSVSANAMSPEQKRMMNIYFLRIRQALYTNQPLLQKSSTQKFDKIPQNQRAYLRATKKKTLDRNTKDQKISYGLEYIDANTQEHKGQSSYNVSRPTTVTPTMADLIVPEVTKNILWLSKEQLYESRPAWSDRYRGEVSSQNVSYSFLSSKDINGINEAEKDLVFITVRGDSEIAFYSKITDNHRELAKDFSFWKDQEKMKFITKDHLEGLRKEFKNKDKQFIAAEVSFFETMNGLLPGFAKWANGTDVVKRVKSAMLPAIQVEGLSEQKFIKVRKKTTQIKIGDKIYDMMQNIPDLGMENIFDGATWSGYDHFDEMSEKGGVPKNAGGIKTGWYYVNERKNLLLAKHAQFRVVKGMQWLDGIGNIIAEVDKNGIIKTSDGEVIQHIMSDDELKKTTGDYDGFNKVIKMPGKAIGIVEYTGKEKKYTKFLRQFFNFVPDNNFSREFIKHIVNTSRPTGIKSRMTKHMNNLQSAEGVKSFVDKAIKEYPDIISNVYTTAIALGGGRHPVISRILLGYSDLKGENRFTKYKGFVVDKVIHNAINLDGFKGTQAIFRPNIKMDTKELELNLSYNVSRFLHSRFKQSTGAEASISNMNKWLQRSPLYVVAGRSPVPHRAGVLYMKVNKLLEENDVVEFNPIAVKRYLEGDQDWDKAYIALLPEVLEPAATQYFNSEEFKESLKGISLAKFISKEKLNIMARDSRYTITEAMNVGKKAIAQIANIQMIYGMLQDVLDSITINGVVFKVRDPKSKIDASEMKEGLKESVETVLRKYLQSSVDNAKYLLLHHWNWTRDSMIEKLFVSEENEPLSSYEGYIDIVNDTIWNKMKEAVEILNSGTFDTQLDFSTLVEKSADYKAFIQNREEMPDEFVPPEYPKVSYKFKEGAININEQLAIAPSDVFEEADQFNKLSSLEYTKNAYLDAHLTAVEEVDRRMMKYIKDNEAALKKEFKKDLKDIMRIVRTTAARYVNGARGSKRGGLLRSISAFTGGGRPIHPNYWDTNTTFIGIRDRFNNYFKELNVLTRRMATLTYLKELTNYTDASDNLRFDMIPLPIDTINKETLLDKFTMQAYFKAFDERLDSGNKLRKELKELKCL